MDDILDRLTRLEDRYLRDMATADANFRALAAQVRRRNVAEATVQRAELERRLAPGPLTSLVRARTGQEPVEPDAILGRPLLERLRADQGMHYSEGPALAAEWSMNLLYDPTFETVPVLASPTTVGTGWTGYGSYWEAQYALNRGTAPSTRLLSVARRRIDLVGQIYSSSELGLEFAWGAGVVGDVTVYLRPKDLTSLPVIGWPYIVAAVRLYVAVARVNLATFTATLQILDSSNNVLDESDTIDVTQLEDQDVEARLLAAHDDVSGTRRWRLRIDITKTTSAGVAEAYLRIGEPSINYSQVASHVPYQPAVGGWQPQAVIHFGSDSAQIGPVQILDASGNATFIISSGEAFGVSPSIEWWSGGSEDFALRRLNSGTLQLDGANLRVQRPVTTYLAFESMDDGDTDSRFTVDVSGKMSWGPGSAAVDTYIERESANVMGLHDAQLRSYRSASDSVAFSARVDADGANRLAALAGGEIRWGDGTNTPDVGLYRNGTRQMRWYDPTGGGSLGITLDGALVANSGLYGYGVSSSGLFSLTGIVDVSVGSNQNNYDPTGWDAASILRIDATSAFNLTGLAQGASGRVVIISNVNATNAITLVHNSGSSLTANRFLLPGGVNLAITNRQSVMLWYDSVNSKWRPIAL